MASRPGAPQVDLSAAQQRRTPSTGCRVGGTDRAPCPREPAARLRQDPGGAAEVGLRARSEYGPECAAAASYSTGPEARAQHLADLSEALPAADIGVRFLHRGNRDPTNSLRLVFHRAGDAPGAFGRHHGQSRPCLGHSTSPPGRLGTGRDGVAYALSHPRPRYQVHRDL